MKRREFNKQLQNYPKIHSDDIPDIIGRDYNRVLAKRANRRKQRRDILTAILIFAAGFGSYWIITWLGGW